MKSIQAQDWTVPAEQPLVVECASEAANVVYLGTDPSHEGFADEHAAVEFGAAGRTPIRRSGVTFRYAIEGWQHVARATLQIFRFGSNLPVGLMKIAAAKGEIAIDGTVSGCNLSEEDRQFLPDGRLTTAGGPYMARLYVDELTPSGSVARRALRTYFDLLPVVVVGAGAAGLGAAKTLLAAGESVVMLEARNRVGGRAYTVTSKSGVAIDLGCQWFHDAPANPWLPEEKEARVKHLQQSVPILGGEPADLEKFERIIEKAISSCGHDQSVRDAIRAIAFTETEDEIKGEHEPEIKTRTGEIANAAATQKMQNYDPSADDTAAKSLFIVKSKLATPVLKREEAAGLVVAGDWRKDVEFLEELRQKKMSSLVAGERQAARIAAEQGVLTEQRQEIENRADALVDQWMKDPGFRLALGIECELEESIEADHFNSVERAASSREEGADAAAQDDAEEQKDGEEHKQGEQQKDDMVVQHEGFAIHPAPRADVPKNDADDANYMPVAGYGETLVRFAATMAEKYGSLLSIRKERHVSKIETKKRYVLIAHGDEITAAAAAIITVPTAVIAGGKIAFDPPLPARVTKAFARIPLGHYKKTVLQLDAESELVAKLDERAEEVIEDEPGAVTDLSLFTLDKKAVVWKFLFRRKERIVVAFTGGAPAKELDNAQDSVVRAAATEALAEALQLELGKVDGAVTEMLTSRWSAEPFSGGAYSYTVPGGAGERRFLRGVVVGGRVVFAGEALWYEAYGTAHGAYLSGEVAAKLVHKAVDA